MARVVRYSEAFKIQLVEDLTHGRFRSPNEAAQAHGIRGKSTIQRWVRQYGREHILERVMRVSKKGEPSEIKKLKDRIRQLEAALADIHMDAALDRTYLKLLCRAQGVDPEEFKKKHAGSVSAKPKKKKGKA